jgi:hypothetical protein
VGCESEASSISGSISERDVCSEVSMVMIFGKKMGQLEGGEDMGKSYSYCLAP